MNKFFTSKKGFKAFFIFFFLSSGIAFAQTPYGINGVYISAWHPDAGNVDWDKNGSVSSSEEWIQLHNRSNVPVNIGNWTIRYNLLGSTFHKFASGTTLQPNQKICVMAQYRGAASADWMDASGVITGVWDDGGFANVWLSNGSQFIHLYDRYKSSDPLLLGSQVCEIALFSHSGRNDDADACQIYCLNSTATEYQDLGVGATSCGTDGTAGDVDGDGIIDILDSCPFVAGTGCYSSSPYSLPKYRTVDGSNNNPNNPKFGATNIPFFRELPAEYGSSDPKNALGGVNRPSPRHLSNQLSDEVEDIQSARNMSGVAYIWGQFIDHDITRTQGGNEAAPISLPTYEPIFKTPIPFTRSAVFPGSGVSAPRDQVNVNTSWIDASQVYGYNTADAKWLRTFQNGKMKVSAGNMLPFNTTTGEFDAPLDLTAPKMDDDNNRTKKTFAAGDPRAAENPNLTSFHTVFVREHNRICDRLKSQGMTNDEEIYQKARKEVGALIQSVTYNQWLPSFGIQLSSYSGYNPSVRPDIMNTFTAAAYRWHTMVENDIILRNNACNGIGPVELPLKNVFFNIDIFRKFDAGVLLRGLAFHPQYETDIKINNGLRNFLFGQGSGLDLPSISIQRGRDHGLPNYNAVRKYYTGSTVSSFSTITSNSKLASKLSTAYGGNINNVDLFVGLFSESLLSGKSVGVTLNAIAKKQFESLRDGDFYFYLNDPAISYEDRIRIANTTLGEVIERNSNAGNFPANVFIQQPCSSDVDDLNDSGEPVCQGTGVTAYANCGYSSGVSLTPGNYTMAALQSKGISNDAISGIKVNIGFAVILYENDNFSGKSVYYASNVECFPSDWNDKVSSIKVICLSNDPSTVNCAGFGGALYEHCFSSPLPISAGTYTKEQLTAVSVSDNTVSAIRVNNGFSITLYKDDNFAGESITFTGPTVTCLPTAWRNVTSSVKVTCLSNPTINNCGQQGVAGGIFESSSSSESMWGISVGLGDYNSSRLSAMGLPTKSLSKLQVTNGYAFTLFDADNLKGNSKVFTGKTSSLGTWDNKTVSMRVTCLTPAPQYLASQDILALEANAEVDRARIEWSTNFGEQADYYIVEKFNGNLGDFEPIATVNATRTGSLESYNQYDNNPQDGDNLYRIKVRFQDGSFKVSEYKVVNFKGISDVRVFPNPASDIINIDLSNYMDKDVEVYLYNYVGQQMGYKKLEKVTYSIMEFDIANKAEGNYLVRIKSKNKRDVIKKVTIVH